MKNKVNIALEDLTTMVTTSSPYHYSQQKQFSPSKKFTAFEKVCIYLTDLFHIGWNTSQMVRMGNNCKVYLTSFLGTEIRLYNEDGKIIDRYFFNRKTLK